MHADEHRQEKTRTIFLVLSVSICVHLWRIFLYFEYSSTMSCSFNWICTSSLRWGRLVMRPFKASRSTSIQPGAGAWAVASRADKTVGLLRLDSRTDTTSFTFTWADGMLHLRPLISMWPCRTIWRACARLVPKPMR